EARFFYPVARDKSIAVEFSTGAEPAGESRSGRLSTRPLNTKGQRIKGSSRDKSPIRVIFFDPLCWISAVKQLVPASGLLSSHSVRYRPDRKLASRHCT